MATGLRKASVAPQMTSSSSVDGGQSWVLQRNPSNIAFWTAANSDTGHTVSSAGGNFDKQPAKDTLPHDSISAALCDTASELHDGIKSMAESVVIMPLDSKHVVQTVSIPGQVDVAEYRSACPQFSACPNQPKTHCMAITVVLTGLKAMSLTPVPCRLQISAAMAEAMCLFCHTCCELLFVQRIAKRREAMNVRYLDWKAGNACLQGASADC